MTTSITNLAIDRAETKSTIDENLTRCRCSQRSVGLSAVWDHACAESLVLLANFMQFESKSNRVKGIAFHPKLTLLAASLHSGSIQMWNFQMGTLVERFDEHDGMFHFLLILSQLVTHLVYLSLQRPRSWHRFSSQSTTLRIRRG